MKNKALITILIALAACGQNEEAQDYLAGAKSDDKYHYDTRPAEQLALDLVGSSNRREGVFEGAYFNEQHNGRVQKLFKVKLPDSWSSAQMSVEISEIDKYSEVLDFSLWFVPDSTKVYTRCVGGQDLGDGSYLGAIAQGCSVGSTGRVDIQSGCINTTRDMGLSECPFNTSNSGTLFVRVAPKEDPSRPNSIYRIIFDTPISFKFALSASSALSENPNGVAAEVAAEELQLPHSWGEGSQEFDAYAGQELKLFKFKLPSKWPRRTRMSVEIRKMHEVDHLLNFALWFVPDSPGVHTKCNGGGDLGYDPMFGVAAQGCRVYRTSHGYTDTVKQFGDASIQSGCIHENTNPILRECNILGDRNHGTLFVAVAPKDGVSVGRVPINFWVSVSDDEEPLYKYGR